MMEWSEIVIPISIFLFVFLVGYTFGRRDG